MRETQLILARKGIMTSEMKAVADYENMSVQTLAEKIAEGKVVIPANKNKVLKRAVGIGEGLTVKVNTNIGTSSDYINLEEEVKKLEVAIKVGTDAVMDLSTGGNLEEIRKTLLKRSPIPLGQCLFIRLL